MVLLPLYAVGTTFFLDGIKTLRHELSATLKYQINSYLFSLEKEMDGIKLNIFNCFEDDNVSSLAFFSSTLGDYDKVKAMRELSQRLFAIQNNSSIIKEAIVYFRDIKKSISSNSQIKDISENEYQVLSAKVNDKHMYLKYDENMITLYETFPYNSIETVTPGYIFVVRFSETGFRNSMDTLKSLGVGGVILHNPDLSFIINTEEKDTIIQNKTISYFNGGNANVGDTYLFKQENYTYLAISNYSKRLNLRLIKYIPEDEFIKPVSSHILLFSLFLLIGIITTLIYSLYMFRFFSSPLARIAGGFKKLESGDLSVRITGHDENEFGYIYTAFNTMVDKLKLLLDDIVSQKEMLQRAKEKQLQAQINPHFLYNSFFILKGRIANEDIEGAQEFCDQLGKYFQYITHIEKDFIKLSEEVEHARIYANIQSIRFGKRITTIIDEIPKGVEELEVPRLILQPLIENAYKYGLDDIKTEGIIRVSFTNKEKTFYIIIEDNGTGIQKNKIQELNRQLLNKENDRELTALGNIHWRIRLHFGSRSGVSIDQDAQIGTRIVIAIKQNGEKDD